MAFCFSAGDRLISYKLPVIIVRWTPSNLDPGFAAFDDYQVLGVRRTGVVSMFCRRHRSVGCYLHGVFGTTGANCIWKVYVANRLLDVCGATRGRLMGYLCAIIFNELAASRCLREFIGIVSAIATGVIRNNSWR